MICDFCTQTGPTWRFASRAFRITYGPGVTGHSDEGWAACDPCCQLILADDRKALAERAVATARAMPDAALEWEVAAQLWAQDLFFRHRVDAPPTPIGAAS